MFSFEVSIRVTDLAAIRLVAGVGAELMPRADAVFTLAVYDMPRAGTLEPRQLYILLARHVNHLDREQVRTHGLGRMSMGRTSWT